jgi:signal transducing adaptor molecule
LTKNANYLFADKATDPSQAFENWDYIMDLCDKVNDDPVDGPKDAVKLIQSNLESGNTKCQKLTLVVLSSLAQNCGPLMHEEIASKSLTGSLLELGTDMSAPESLRQQVFEVMETLSREFRSNPELKEVEIAFNRLKQTDPSILPPVVPQKHQITDEDRRREEEELQRVLALSLEESQEDPRYNNFESYNSSSFASSSNNFTSSNNNFDQTNIKGSNVSQTSNPFTQNQPANNTQSQQQPHQANPSANLLDLEDNPPPSTPRSASSVRAVRAIYDLTSTEPGELTFRRGDIIVVIESVYRDWWKGSLRGEIGIFPLNYVEPIVDPTNEEVIRESKEEQAIFAELKNIEKVLTILNDAHKQNPAPKISENQELQELYNSTQAVRPKLAKILEKLNQKRDELTDLDNKLLSARRAYDELLEGHLSSTIQQPAHSDTNPFQSHLQQPQQQVQQQQPFNNNNNNSQPLFNSGPQQQQQHGGLQPPNVHVQPQLTGSHLQAPMSAIPAQATGSSSHFPSANPVNISAQLTGPESGPGGPPSGPPQGQVSQHSVGQGTFQNFSQGPLPQQHSPSQNLSSFNTGGNNNARYSGPPPDYSTSSDGQWNNNNSTSGGNSQHTGGSGFSGNLNINHNNFSSSPNNSFSGQGYQPQQQQGFYGGNNGSNY